MEWRRAFRSLMPCLWLNAIAAISSASWYFEAERCFEVPTHTKLHNLTPQSKFHKVNDCDGLNLAVTSAGSISFCYNSSVNGLQESVAFAGGGFPL
ncbi:hypothetical protein Brsp01_35650 [Brucella sp. NBRC 12950]|nr:hypothetical protein Brsp01_35650 [Brucella sp. NBRC 12950]